MEKSNFEIFKLDNGKAEIKVKLDEDTVWLNLNQLSELFKRDKSVISRHINNIFKERELIREAVVAFFATTAIEGKSYQVDFYNIRLIVAADKDISNLYTRNYNHNGGIYTRKHKSYNRFIQLGLKYQMPFKKEQHNP